MPVSLVAHGGTYSSISGSITSGDIIIASVLYVDVYMTSYPPQSMPSGWTSIQSTNSGRYNLWGFTYAGSAPNTSFGSTTKTYFTLWRGATLGTSATTTSTTMTNGQTVNAGTYQFSHWFGDAYAASYGGDFPSDGTEIHQENAALNFYCGYHLRSGTVPSMSAVTPFDNFLAGQAVYLLDSAPQTYNEVATGGARLSGVAVSPMNAPVSGGIRAAGDAVQTARMFEFPFAGIAASGAANLDSAPYIVSGGAAASGEAQVSISMTYTETTTGGFVNGSNTDANGFKYFEILTPEFANQGEYHWLPMMLKVGSNGVLRIQDEYIGNLQTITRYADANVVKFFIKTPSWQSSLLYIMVGF